MVFVHNLIVLRASTCLPASPWLTLVFHLKHASCRRSPTCHCKHKVSVLCFKTFCQSLAPAWFCLFGRFSDSLPREYLPLSSPGYQHVTNIVIVGPNEGNIVEVTPPMDDEHFNFTANPIEFHYTSSYMAQLNALDGAASGASPSRVAS